jgi:uncharacterized protein (TIGR02284 family)
MKEDKSTTGPLQSLLRGEISALETYEQATRKIGDDPDALELRRIASDHADAVTRLRSRIALEDEEPAEGSGAWGAFARAVQGSANLFGDRAALEALRKGEEHGLAEYREALDDDETPEEVRRDIRAELLPRQEAHIRTLDRMLERR